VDPVSTSSISGNQVQASDGVFAFEAVNVIAVPGTSIELDISVTNLETYGNDINFLTDFPTITASPRLCVSGESYTSDNQCVVCAANYYLYEPPTNVT